VLSPDGRFAYAAEERSGAALAYSRQTLGAPRTP
jgi:hypothetical protein